MEKTSIGIEISQESDILKTEEAILYVKERFRRRLSRELNLVNVSAPVAVPDGTGINDDLNGVEKPVSFEVKGINNRRISIVQSLAKWKRVRLKEFGIEPGKGILTDMRAIRPDEDLSPIHSIYVDQWDWERCILPEQRTLSYLKSTVEAIYEALKATEKDLYAVFPEYVPVLPDKIHFIHAEELLMLYPDLTPKQRETKIAQKFGAVFVIGIGASLSNGEPHDGRAPDYDDWSSLNEDGYIGLNGDIILWYPVLKSALEISSMGIRVDKQALERQLMLKGCTERKNLLFHRMLLADMLPLSIGGGIGQSRLCMFFLKKRHIGEVQSSVWPDSTHLLSEESGIRLL
ncbi:MAG: aspartate--ammonia ligase [Bacteroidales bacterium]|nr:aspartate--ammonia ligase [Bacteroidales bacterium]